MAPGLQELLTADFWKTVCAMICQSERWIYSLDWTAKYVLKFQAMARWSFSPSGLLFLRLPLLPAYVTKACSDGTQPVCSPEACSMEAFQLLQQDLTKISCSLLNYNLLSASFFFLPLLSLFHKKKPPSLFCCQLICVFLCVCVCVWTCMYAWSCLSR